MTTLLVVGAGATAIFAIWQIVRLIWWLVLPRVRQQITGDLDIKIDEVHTAVTRNGHADKDNPTLRDQLTDVQHGQVEMAKVVNTILTRIENLEIWAAASDEDHDSRLTALEGRGEN